MKTILYQVQKTLINGGLPPVCHREPSERAWRSRNLKGWWLATAGLDGLPRHDDQNILLFSQVSISCIKVF